MIKNTQSGILPLICFLFLFTSCSKDAGPGGLASIKGKVYGRDITTSGNLKSEGYLGDQRVFISVANDPYSFDRVNTSYDGSFEFKFLQKGSYDIWAFSDCDTCAQKQQLVIMKGISISDKKQTVTVADLEVIY